MRGGGGIDKGRKEEESLRKKEERREGGREGPTRVEASRQGETRPPGLRMMRTHVEPTLSHLSQSCDTLCLRQTLTCRPQQSPQERGCREGGAQGKGRQGRRGANTPQSKGRTPSHADERQTPKLPLALTDDQ